MFAKLNTLLRYHAHRYGHFRFEEPIVVIESDDWGKIHSKPDGDYPANFGERTTWSYDQLENQEELESLFSLLKSYENRVARPPVFTANFIVSNPDFEATKKANYQSLVLKNIDEAFPELMPVWKKGCREKIFFPQYHGRLHYNPQRYLSALQNDERVRHLFEQGINGGMENFSGQEFSFYSEYFNFETEASAQNLDAWIETGFSQFEKIFGYKSKSTIAPNYVIHPQSLQHFANQGVKYMQASNKFFRLENGKEIYENHCLGTTLNGGLMAITRNHKFEPCRGKKEWEATFTINSAHGWFKRGVPFILDSHRLNYVGKFAEKSRQQLKTVLDDLTKVDGIQFLTTTELGEAIENDGHFTDAISGAPRKLTPKDNFLRKAIRQNLK